MQVSKDDSHHSDFVGDSKIQSQQERWIYRGAMIVFGIQALVLIGLSIWQFLHFGVTWDYSIMAQGWYLIAHGHLNPHLTVAAVPFWRVHFELLMWPLAVLYWIWPNGPTLLIVQDVASVAAEWFGFLIVWHYLRRTHLSSRLIKWLSVLAITLLVLSPWVFWADSFDFHFHEVEAGLLMVMLWAFYTDRRITGYVFAGLTMLASQISATYLVPAGLVIFLMGRRRRLDGAIVALMGLGWFLFSEKMGVNGLGFVGIAQGAKTVGSSQPPIETGAAGALIGLVMHPVPILKDIWVARREVWANFGPSGYLGIFSAWGLLIPALIVVETALGGGAPFLQPGDASIGIWALATVGTIIVLSRLYTVKVWLGLVATLGVGISAIGWAGMGYAALPIKYTMVSNQGAQVLTTALHTIPPNAEVVASQGVLGRWAMRSQAYPLFEGSFPVTRSVVYFVISPYQGINILHKPMIFSDMAYLAQTLHASVVTHQDNIWIFKWTPPLSVHQVIFPSSISKVSAWTADSTIGQHVLKGPVTQWRLAADNTPAGYVMNGDYWRLGRGSYQASVKLQTTGSVNVEVWNDTGNLLLARRTIPATHGIETLNVPFVIAHQFARNIYSGVGPFRYQPVVPTLDNNIEVRVWTPGHEKVAVYTVQITGE